MIKTYLQKEFSEKWFNFILKHRNKQLNWSNISNHPNLTMEMIQNNLDIPWEWYFISLNKNKFSA